jgi:hypothetical protein
VLEKSPHRNVRGTEVTPRFARVVKLSFSVVVSFGRYSRVDWQNNGSIGHPHSTVRHEVEGSIRLPRDESNTSAYSSHGH